MQAGQITQLLSRPASLSSVTNPLPATGGSGGDDQESVRAAAPVSLSGLGRARHGERLRQPGQVDLRRGQGERRHQPRRGCRRHRRRDRSGAAESRRQPMHGRRRGHRRGGRPRRAGAGRAGQPVPDRADRGGDPRSACELGCDGGRGTGGAARGLRLRAARSWPGRRGERPARRGARRSRGAVREGHRPGPGAGGGVGRRTLHDAADSAHRPGTGGGDARRRAVPVEARAVRPEPPSPICPRRPPAP